MSVHKAITKHVNQQNAILAKYQDLDGKREAAIAVVIDQCERGLPFDTTTINEITSSLNELSNQIENLPKRKYVTSEMVMEYVNRRK